MVRLIDSDKMLKRIESWNTSDAMDKALYNFTLNRIIEQPTVDAIPVKWLEDRIRLYRDCGNDLRANVIENEIELWRAKNRRGE